MSSKPDRPLLSKRKPKSAEVDAFISGASAAAPLEKKEGKLPPEGSVRINANIPKDLYQAFKIRAVQEGRTMTDILDDLIRTYLSK